jgi:hypothetical protein
MTSINASARSTGTARVSWRIGSRPELRQRGGCPVEQAAEPVGRQRLRKFVGTTDGLYFGLAPRRATAIAQPFRRREVT